MRFITNRFTRIKVLVEGESIDIKQEITIDQNKIGDKLIFQKEIPIRISGYTSGSISREVEALSQEGTYIVDWKDTPIEKLNNICFYLGIRSFIITALLLVCGYLISLVIPYNMLVEDIFTAFFAFFLVIAILSAIISAGFVKCYVFFNTDKYCKAIEQKEINLYKID